VGELMLQIMRRPVLVMGLIAVGLLLVIFVQIFTTMEQDAEDAAEVTATNLVQVITRDILRTVESYDRALQGTQKMLNERRLDKPASTPMSVVAADASIFGPSFSSLKATNRTGEVIYDSQNVTPAHVNVSAREFFQVQRDASDAGLFFGEPYRSPSSSEWEISLSRRLTAPDGSFDGVVVGSIKLAYFSSLLADLDVGSHGIIVLLKNSGAIIARQPFKQSLLGQRINNAIIPYADPQRQNARTVGKSPLDGA
jgi:hypothetical protein